MARSLQWSNLTKLGKSRVIQSSYVWLIVLPAIAKILEPMRLLGEDSTFEVFGAAVELHVGLPFSWKIFYVSAVFLSIASLTYQFFCPAITKDLDGNLSRVSEVKLGTLMEYASRMRLSERTRPLIPGGPPSAVAVWGEAEKANGAARWICAIAYVIGLALITWVILQNLVYVVPLIFAG